jgi:hypothetical protein
MSYRQAVISVGTTPTLLGTPGPAGMLVQNLSAVVVFLGGPAVTADATATGGLTMPASVATPLLVPSGTRPDRADADDGLYARVVTGTANVAVLGAV